jgi:hypothetical protein
MFPGTPDASLLFNRTKELVIELNFEKVETNS